MNLYLPNKYGKRTRQWLTPVRIGRQMKKIMKLFIHLNYLESACAITNESRQLNQEPCIIALPSSTLVYFNIRKRRTIQLIQYQSMIDLFLSYTSIPTTPTLTNQLPVEIICKAASKKTLKPYYVSTIFPCVHTTSQIGYFF